MKTFICDFHVHTLLSPCAEVEMTPHHIVMRAAQYGISTLAITDHNSSGNILAALEAGEKYGVKVDKADKGTEIQLLLGIENLEEENKDK